MLNPCVRYVSVGAGVDRELNLVIHNVRSFRLHAEDIFADVNFTRSHIVICTEARSSPAWPLSSLVQTEFDVYCAESEPSARDGFDNVLVFLKNHDTALTAGFHSALSQHSTQFLFLHIRGRPDPDFYLIAVYVQISL